jgi:hypothetical protein
VAKPRLLAHRVDVCRLTVKLLDQIEGLIEVRAGQAGDSSVVSGLWDLDYFKEKNRAVRQIIGGWQLSGNLPSRQQPALLGTTWGQYGSQ